MTEPIIYIDHSDIREGQHAAVRRHIGDLVAFVEEHEPQIISYGFYLDEDTGTMTLVAVHPDTESLEFHMEVAGPRFRPFAELIRMRAIEVYGSIGERARGQLEDKARLLGGARLVVQPLERGFSRLREPASPRPHDRG